MKQVDEVKRLLPSIRFDVVSIETGGDKDKLTPLSAIDGADIFTREIESALLSGFIDAAIHSAKDLEEDPPAGLMIAAMTKSISPYDALVSKDNLTLEGLPSGAVIGTSSIKRKNDILNFRSDLVVKDIRGNIDERLRQLDDGHFDAVIIAYAALVRLGYQDRAVEVISSDIVAPHPLQGRLAIQIRSDRVDLAEIFRRIDAS
jgi:hydroxymethylbilane synthase